MENACYIGIDLGGTSIKIGLVHNDKLVDRRVLAAESIQGIQAHLSKVDDAILAMLQAAGLAAPDGIAMAFPGIVDTMAKKVLSTNKKYDDAPSFDLERYYRQNWGAPLYIDNDARMATVGEWKFGAGKQHNDLVMVTLGTGIGTSVIMEGKLLRGKHYQAGCLGGHFVIDYHGKQCTCGNTGCVEAEAATWNVASIARNHNKFSESLLYHEAVIDFAALFSAARLGDEVASDIKNNCLDIWAAAVITYIHAYDPEIIIMGGGILQSAADIIPEIQEKVSARAWTPWGKVRVVCSELGDAAGILGAVFSLQHKL